MWGAWSQVRRDERRDALLAFMSLFMFIAGHSVMETARDALFLSRLPVSQLPFVYLAVAGVTFVATRFIGRTRSGDGTGLTWGLLLSAGLTGVLSIVGRGEIWSVYAIYIWSAAMATLVVGNLYVLLGDRFTVTQAKRLYGFIGAGSVAGAIAGNALASVLAPVMPPRTLLAVTAGILAVSAAGPFMLGRGARREARTAEPVAAMPIAAVWRQPYARRLGLLMIMTTATLTAVDYVFKLAVVEVVAPDGLALFFARFYLAMSVASLIMQLWVVRPIVRVLNTYGALLVLPALLTLGTLGVAMTGGMVAALALKGVGATMRHSLHATASELLYVPMARRMRSAAKTTIDMVGQRFGQALASLGILGAIALSITPAQLCVAILVLCLMWLAVAYSIRGDYLRLLRETLSQSALRSDGAFPELDLASLESLIGALNSPDDSEVRAALTLLEERGRANIVPALILYHPSPEVVEDALDLLIRSGRTDFLPTAQRLANHEYAAVRAASLRAQIAIDPREDILRERLEVTCPVVRATAIVGLSAKGYASPEETATVIDAIITDGSDIAKEALAKAITYRPSQRFEDVLLRLAKQPSPMVQVAATAAMAKAPTARYLPHLLRMLPVRETREDVRQVLIAMGDTAMEFVFGALVDTDTPVAVRRHLPRTLHRFAAQRSAPLLVEQLAREHDGVVRFKILRALGRLKTDNPELVLDKDVLREQADETLSVAFRLIDWGATLERGCAEHEKRRTESHELLSALVGDKEQSAIERLFRIFGLLHPKADMVTLYRGLRSDIADVRASSRELLEHVVPTRWRQAVLSLVDDGGAEVRLAGAGAFHTSEGLAHDALLRQLADSDSASLRALAAYHADELGLAAPTPQPANTAEHATAGLADVATALLGAGGGRSPT